MTREEFNAMFSAITEERNTEKMGEVFNLFCESASLSDYGFDYYAGESYKFFEYSAQRFKRDMYAFAVFCNDCKDIDAEFFILDNENRVELMGYYFDLDFIDNAIEILWNAISNAVNRKKAEIQESVFSDYISLLKSCIENKEK